MTTQAVLKKIGLGALLIVTLAACAAKNSINASTVVDQNQSNGGGVDSSGGEILQSSVDQVDEALRDIERKSSNALFRAFLIMDTTNRFGVDRDYGVGLYDILDMVLTGNKFTVPGPVTQLAAKKIVFRIDREKPCMTGTHKAGSATGSNGVGVICLSVPELRKISPASLELETVALAMHEVTHLYLGKDDEKPVQLQTFFVQNPKFTVVDPVFVKQMNDMFDTVDAGFVSLLTAKEKKNVQALCLGLGQLGSSIRSIISIYDVSRGSLANPIKFYNNLMRSRAAVEISLGFCTGVAPSPFLVEAAKVNDLVPVGAGDWQALAKNLEGVIYPFFTARHLFLLNLDPASGQAVAGEASLVRELLEALSTEESIANRGVDAKAIAAFEPTRDIYCRDGRMEIVGGKFSVRMNDEIVHPVRLYKGPEGEILNLKLMGNNVMVRALTPMKGAVSLQTMVEHLQVGAARGGLVTLLDRGSSDLMLVGALGLGLNDRVDFSILDPKTAAYATATCRFSATPLAAKDLTIEQPPVTEPMAVQLSDVGRKYEVDPSFYRAAKAQLKIFAGQANGENYVRGALAKTTSLTGVGWTNNSLELFTADEKIKCIIYDELAKKKGVDLHAWALKLAAGEISGVSCYKDGALNMPVETFSRAALEFEITP